MYGSKLTWFKCADRNWLCLVRVGLKVLVSPGNGIELDLCVCRRNELDFSVWYRSRVDLFGARIIINFVFALE